MAENYLNDTNPEIMRAMPRFGGLAKLLQDGPPKASLPPSRVSTPDGSSSKRGSLSSRSKTKTKKGGVTISDKTSTASLTGMHKGFGKLFESAVRVSQMVIEKEDPKMSDMTKEYRIFRGLVTTPWVQEIDEILEEELKEELPNPVQDSIDLLAICISTVMLLAVGYSGVPREHLLWTLNFIKLIKDEFDTYPPNIQGLINHIEKLHGSLTSVTDIGDPEFHSTAIEKPKAEEAPPASIEEETPPEEIAEEAAAEEEAAEGDTDAE